VDCHCKAQPDQRRLRGRLPLLRPRLLVRGQQHEVARLGAQDSDLAQASLISGPSVKQERLAALVVTRQIEDNLVIEDNLAENLQYFYKIEDRTKCHMLELRPLNSTIPDSRSLFRRVPFSIRVTGTYEQVVGFLYGIETGPRLANITSLSVRRREPASLTVVLDMNVEQLGKK
jgi:hypothetical protein